MSHENDTLKFGGPGDAIVMACPPDVNPDDDSVRHYGGLLVCESASAEWRRRIVACVNSFAGISTENIETNLPVKELARRYNVAAKHRDVLIKALDLFKRADNEDQLIAAMDNANKIMKDIFGVEGGAQ